MYRYELPKGGIGRGMKIVGYTCLHMGADYLGYAISSAIDFCDTYYVLYSPKGFARREDAPPCPDTKEELKDIAIAAGNGKVKWVEMDFANESHQRNIIYKLEPEADIVVITDHDEVWHEDMLATCISKATSMNNQIHSFMVPFIHYWRSFRRAVLCQVPNPRIVCPKAPVGNKHIVDTPHRLNHFGYAQRPEIVGYKRHVDPHAIHEWRKHWFDEIFMTNKQTCVHPLLSWAWWNPVDVAPLDWMPEFMMYHPYFDMDVIGDVIRED